VQGGDVQHLIGALLLVRPLFVTEIDRVLRFPAFTDPYIGNPYGPIWIRWAGRPPETRWSNRETARLPYVYAVLPCNIHARWDYYSLWPPRPSQHATVAPQDWRDPQSVDRPKAS